MPSPDLFHGFEDIRIAGVYVPLRGIHVGMTGQNVKNKGSMYFAHRVMQVCRKVYKTKGACPFFDRRSANSQQVRT